MAGLLLFPFQTVAGWWHEEWNLPSKTLTVSVSFTQLMTFMLSHHLSGFLSHRGNTQDTVQGSIHIWSNLRKAKWQRHKNTTSSFTVPDYTALACMNMQQQGNMWKECVTINLNTWLLTYTDLHYVILHKRINAVIIHYSLFFGTCDYISQRECVYSWFTVSVCLINAWSM